MKGGEAIVDLLARRGTPYVFGLCGHGILGLLDALYDRRSELKVVSAHHESVAGFMADAYFRVAHVPVATFTSCGPGSANLPVALASAFMDSSAFLAITGNVPTSQWNRGPFQETGRHVQGDVVNALRPYVKRSFQPTRPEMLPRAMAQAYSLMLSGRPGPVHVDVPLDLFVESVDDALVADAFVTSARAERSAAEPDAVAEAIRRLRAARRPVIVAGHGVEVSGAEAELARLAEHLRVPVAVTPLGKGVMDMRSPLCLGSTGRNGTYPANAATRTADVILAIGTRFDDRATSSWIPGFSYRIPPTELIQVDIDPAEIGRNYPVSLALFGDARTVLRQLLAAAREPVGRDERAEYWGRIEHWRERWRERTEPHRTSDARPIRPERVVHEVRGALPDDGIVLADVGVHHNWIVSEFEARRTRSVLQSWGFASMGFGVAGALGAKLAAPDRPVVSVCGDGGFLMTPSAVATAVEYAIPVVWVVWNNLGYCSIRDQQRGYFGAERELATSFTRADTGDLVSVDFAALARSMGAEASLVDGPSELADRLRWAIDLGRPALLDVRVDRDIRPPATASWDLPPLPHPLPDFGWGTDEE